MHSFEVKTTVPKQCMSALLGRGGSQLTKLKGEHDVRINFVDLKEDLVQVEIEGTRKSCLVVQENLRNIIDEMVCFF